MTDQPFTPDDIARFIANLQPQDFVNDPFAQNVDGFDDDWQRPRPTLLPVPEITRGFRIRVDLRDTKPPVWRRLDLPGDITLDRLDLVVQAAMGWQNAHLHNFRAGNGRFPPVFLTEFDVSEGDTGVLENDVRLDQVIAKVGDRLWYDYDFGDGWEHVLRVEKVLETSPDGPMCLAGRMACPPEDCGGPHGYAAFARWVRSGYDARYPRVFESAADARAWLPMGWDPDAFDVAEANETIALFTAPAEPLHPDLVRLLDRAEKRWGYTLHDAIQRAAPYEATVSPHDAAVLTDPFRILLDVIGDRSELTSAGYLKPNDVREIAERIGVTGWWIGTANREDLTPPVRDLRAAARALGLVSVRKGQITPTLAARRCADHPEALLAHIVSRLPIGTHPADRDAGWAALTAVGSGDSPTTWPSTISTILYEVGWRDARDEQRAPRPESPTFDVLEILSGQLRTGRRTSSVNPGIAAVARAVLRHQPG